MTKIVLRGRREGKTTQLIQWMLDAPKGEKRVVAVSDARRAKALLDRCRETGLDIESWQFITHNEAVQGSAAIWNRMSGPDTKLAIDDIDLFVSRAIRYKVTLASASWEEHPGVEASDNALMVSGYVGGPYAPVDIKTVDKQS